MVRTHMENAEVVAVACAALANIAASEEQLRDEAADDEEVTLTEGSLTVQQQEADFQGFAPTPAPAGAGAAHSHHPPTASAHHHHHQYAAPPRPGTSHSVSYSRPSTRQHRSSESPQLSVVRLALVEAGIAPQVCAAPWQCRHSRVLAFAAGTASRSSGSLDVATVTSLSIRRRARALVYAMQHLVSLT